MSIAAPLPKGTRRTDYTALPGQTVFGPTPWLAFDPADIIVFRRLSSVAAWQKVTSGVTVTLSAAQIGFVTATFSAPQTGAFVRLESRRVHDRMTDVTRASSIITALLERELDKVAAVLQELRRDVDETDTAGAIEARNEAVAARDEVRERYLGSFDHAPEAPELGFPLVEGALFSLIDQPDPEDEGLYVRRAGVWRPLGVLPSAFERRELVLPDPGQTIVPVPGGYTVGMIDVVRNGLEQLQGDAPGTGDDDPDCVASDGINVVFPSGVLTGVDWLLFKIKRPFSVADIAAGDVAYPPIGGGPDVTVEAAIDALDLGKVPITRQVTGGGLATGGGGLGVDRVITVPKATAAEIVTGTDDAKATTPKAVKDALATLGSLPAVATILTVNGDIARASLDLALPNTFKFYHLIVDACEPVTAGQALLLRLATDGVPTFLAGATDYVGTGLRVNTGGSTPAAWNHTGSSSISLSQSPGNGGNPASYEFLICNPGPGRLGRIRFNNYYRRSDAGTYYEEITGNCHLNVNSNRWTHLRLIFNSGNIAAGMNYRLIGFN